MLIDTHAHVNFKAFENDFDEVIKRSLSEDIWLINVGSKYETSKKAIEIAERYDSGVYAAIGLHPIHAKDEDYHALEYGNLCRSDKVVAIGEIGLDKFKDYGLFLKEQKEVFLKQLDLAKELNLPVIIHCRMAHQDLIKELRIMNYELRIRGVIHCFTGTWEEAKKYLDLGFYLGINGIMYKFDLKEVIKKAPLERILLETDCPYLGKEKRNEPIFVRYIAKDIARIKNIPFEQVSQTTTQNAQKLFGI
jgi:TatD DNase family protein